MRKPSVAIVDDDAGFAQYSENFSVAPGVRAALLFAGRRASRLNKAVRTAGCGAVGRHDARLGWLGNATRAQGIAAGGTGHHAVGAHQAATIVEAVRLGAADYVLKPDDPEGIGEAALEAAIRNALEKNSLVSEVVAVREQLRREDRGRLGHQRNMRAIATVIEQVADSDVGVLLRGESGVGKEVIARDAPALAAPDQPFVKVNCAALPADLLESELFGHERGAFTGAGTTAHRQVRVRRHRHDHARRDRRDAGRRSRRSCCTCCRTASSPGSAATSAIEVDVRVLAATNRDLEAMMGGGTSARISTTACR